MGTDHICHGQASYIGVIRADQTHGSDHSDHFGTVGSMLVQTHSITIKYKGYSRF